MNPIVKIGMLFITSATAFVYDANRFQGEPRQEVPSPTQSEVDASDRVRPIYAAVLSGIRGLLQAHITETGDPLILVDLPALPENLYKDRYAGTVIFGGASVWTIEVFAPRPPDLRSPPTLTIRFDEPTEPQEGPRLIFSLDTSTGEVAIIDINGVVPSASPLPAFFPEEDSDSVIAQLTQSIVEGQLLSGSSPR
jgi:hypothetical protein